MNELIPLEDDEQINFVEYLERRGLKYTAIPNHTYTPHMSQKIKNRKIGLRPGFPDLVVVLPGIGLACPEMKRIKGGKLSPNQKEWIDALNTIPNVEARECKGCAEAIAFIEELYPLSKSSQLYF